jgi:hypothetical protein
MYSASRSLGDPQADKSSASKTAEVARRVILNGMTSI